MHTTQVAPGTSSGSLLIGLCHGAIKFRFDLDVAKIDSEKYLLTPRLCSLTNKIVLRIYANICIE